MSEWEDNQRASFTPEGMKVVLPSRGGTVATSTVTVGIASTAVLAANTSRGFLVLQNDSTEDIYVDFGKAAVLNAGLRLNAAGGAIVLDKVVPTQAINAICASGTKRLLVIEG